MVNFRCELKKDGSTVKSDSVSAPNRLEALKKWIRDQEYYFESRDWNEMKITVEN